LQACWALGSMWLCKVPSCWAHVAGLREPAGAHGLSTKYKPQDTWIPQGMQMRRVGLSVWDMKEAVAKGISVPVQPPPGQSASFSREAGHLHINVKSPVLNGRVLVCVMTLKCRPGPHSPEDISSFTHAGPQQAGLSLTAPWGLRISRFVTCSPPVQRTCVPLG
jgi:hypothetical protein